MEYNDPHVTDSNNSEARKTSRKIKRLGLKGFRSKAPLHDNDVDPCVSVSNKPEASKTWAGIRPLSLECPKTKSVSSDKDVSPCPNDDKPERMSTSHFGSRVKKSLKGLMPKTPPSDDVICKYSRKRKIGVGLPSFSLKRQNFKKRMVANVCYVLRLPWSAVKGTVNAVVALVIATTNTLYQFYYRLRHYNHRQMQNQYHYQTFRWSFLQSPRRPISE